MMRVKRSPNRGDQQGRFPAEREALKKRLCVALEGGGGRGESGLAGVLFSICGWAGTRISAERRPLQIEFFDETEIR